MSAKGAPAKGAKVVRMRANKLPPKLPRVSPVVTEAVMQMLIQDHGMTRPPEKAAAILALIAELHRNREPFPERRWVAEKLGCSIHTVDAVLSTRMDEGYLEMEVGTESSNIIQQRHGVIRKRFYVPSERLLAVVDTAKNQRRTG